MAAFAYTNKKLLGIVSGIFLGLVPWMQISRAVTSNVSITLSGLLSVMAVGVIVHVVYLAANMTAVHVLQLGGKGEDREGTPPPPLDAFSLLCYVCVYVYVYMCMSMSVCVCLCVYVCVYVYVYVYVSNFTESPASPCALCLVRSVCASHFRNNVTMLLQACLPNTVTCVTLRLSTLQLWLCFTYAHTLSDSLLFSLSISLCLLRVGSCFARLLPDNVRCSCINV